MARLQGVLNTIATALVIFVCLGMLWTMYAERRMPVLSATAKPARTGSKSSGSAPPLPTTPLSLADAATKGSPTARVGILEYSDYQCPYCGVFARDTFPEIDKQYILPGKVRFIYRHFPLETIHPNALPAAVSAACAGEQGKFWEMQDVLFHNQKDLTDTKLSEFAEREGLDPKQFASCRSSNIVSKIKADEALGQSAAVTGTPTFFIGLININGALEVAERFSGAKGFTEFKKTLDPLISTTASPAQQLRR